ncbi:MAG: methyltransferase domain-containing protein [Bacteroidia bacterium]|nr:methyltransferase domain-containing protein [Bacteroidia bacterium]
MTPTFTPVRQSACPVCQAADIAPVMQATDYLVSRSSFEIWQCRSCGCRFTQDTPDESSIGAFYQSESYISHSNTRKGLLSRLYQLARRFTLQGKRNLVIRLSGRRQGELLDIGCGTGDFLLAMQEAGWQVSGLEPDAGARELARTRGLAVAQPDQLFSLRAGSFDVITLWHVLEHVHRLHAYLDQIRTLLRPGGLLLIAVPNYQSHDARHYQSRWAAYDVPRHLYHFTPGSMAQLLEARGFRIESADSMPLDGFYVSLLSERYRQNAWWLPAGLWHGLISWLHGTMRPRESSAVLYRIRLA